MPFSDAVKSAFKLAINIIIGALFHPIYSILNAIVLGHQAQETPLAGLGLGSLTVGIIALAIGSTGINGVSTFISQAFGQQEFRMCAVYRNRCIFLALTLFTILMVPTIFIERIFLAIGQQAEVAAFGAQYVQIVMPFISLHFIGQSYASFSKY